MEFFFSDDGVFEGTWVIHNKVTDDYLVYVKVDPYQGDSYPPLDTEFEWQLFSNGELVPGSNFVLVVINAETTCRPTVVPTRAPTDTPTQGPTERYLCVIITWDVDDEAYNRVPHDFYGAYYYNDLSMVSNNDFSKFPIYPSTLNSKPVFTKKQNSNSLSFFFVSNPEANQDTWVFDSEDHSDYLASTVPHADHDHPVFSEYPVNGTIATGVPYEWSLFLDGTYSKGLTFLIEMSASLVTCEKFDTRTPTALPSGFPTRSPTPKPSVMPTPAPSPMPSVQPTPAPSPSPSSMPSPSPTDRPTSQLPTSFPTPLPTQYPTFQYDCINITSLDAAYARYDGIYSLNSGTRNDRVWFTDGNTGFDVYYVPAAVMIDNAWVIEGSSNDKMAIHDVDLGTWTRYGQSDEVPPYGTFTWKEFASPPNPASYDEIQLTFSPLLNCVPTQGPTAVPTEFPTTSTPAPTTPSPTTVPSVSPSGPPTTPPTGTPTADPTKVCRVLVVVTPLEPGSTSVFEGNYIIQSTFRNGKFQWYNSNNGYNIFFVNDEWLPSSWVMQGDDGMDEIAVFDEGSDGHPNTIADIPDGEEWVLFYWGHNLQKRNETMRVQIYCIDSLPPSSKPTPGPSPLPSVPPTTLPSPSPSLNPSPAPSPMPSYVPTTSPSHMPSFLPSSSPSRSPTLPTRYPTPSPTNLPTRFPTSVCPCIFVNSTDSSTLNGMYQIEDESFNSHDRWVNYDNLADIHWNRDAELEGYWVISVDTQSVYAVIWDTTGEYGHTPPIGSEMWKISEKQYWTTKWVILECTTCAPTPAPTSLPTPISTPSPTTPSPTIVPTISPSQTPSSMPSPSPTALPTTLSPTPLSKEPTLVPSSSPSASPTTPVPSASPSLVPSPSPSAMPSALPTPSPTGSPINPTSMPSPSPTKLPTTYVPSFSPSAMPSPSPSPAPSSLPSPSPTALPTTTRPSSSPSNFPTPSPSPMPSAMPSPSPSPSPTLSPSTSPTSVPTDTCPCLVVEDPDSQLDKYVGLYRYHNNTSPNSNQWMWERLGDNTKEVIYFSQFGTASARWVIKGSIYGEWAETSAKDTQARPPNSDVWLINDKDGNFYQKLTVICSQCEVTPSPTPDPTESPTSHPTSLAPTPSPTPMPSIYCLVLNITDFTNGYYSGVFEMDVLPYNDRFKWTELSTGETLHWADTAMFEHEGSVNNIWMLGFEAREGEKDSNFLILEYPADEIYPPLHSIEQWKEYAFNEYTNQSSEVMIHCEDTVLPTVSPTKSPSPPFCTELFVNACCDPVYADIEGAYQASALRGGKDMYTNADNGYSIYYTKNSNGDYWSIRSEDDELIWVESSEHNYEYPPWDTYWDLKNHALDELKVMVMINCSESFSPSSFPTTKQPTTQPTSLEPSPMPTYDPTFHPTDTPTVKPTEACTALDILEQTGSETKFDGTYARLSEPKNGKTEWINYNTGADVYWIDRGIWANTWIIRSNDADYAMTTDDADSLHPPVNDEWSALGSGLLQGDKYLQFHIVCTTQPPAPAPTTYPSLAPTCEGNAIHIEDPCDSNMTGGIYAGYYNYEYTHDGKNVYVRVDGEYEVLYIADNLFSELWMIRPHNGETCEEYWVVDGYADAAMPPANAFWDSYTCACNNINYRYRCNFRITCMQTKAPIPTEFPTSRPTDKPVDTPSPTSHPSFEPTSNPTPHPTNSPTDDPTLSPTFAPTTQQPTMSPLPYECIAIDLQPCINITDRVITFYERTENYFQMTSNYYETKLYTEQKGYNFVAKKDMVMYEAGMAFTNLASYQSITVRVFESATLLYESDYSLPGEGETKTIGIPRGDYYTFRNMNVQLTADTEYSVVFVVHCPATKTSVAQYPLCAPHHDTYMINDFGTAASNIYAYGEEYDLPTESDLYAPFIRICYADGILEK